MAKDSKQFNELLEDWRLDEITREFESADAAGLFGRDWDTDFDDWDAERHYGED